MYETNIPRPLVQLHETSSQFNEEKKWDIKWKFSCGTLAQHCDISVITNSQHLGPGYAILIKDPASFTLSSHCIWHKESLVIWSLIGRSTDAHFTQFCHASPPQAADTMKYKTKMMMIVRMMMSFKFFMNMERAKLLLLFLKVSDVVSRSSVLSIKSSNLSPRFDTDSMFFTIIWLSSSRSCWTSDSLVWLDIGWEKYLIWAARTLENSLFIANGRAVCTLDPYVAVNFFFISCRKANALDLSKSSSVIQR